MWRFTLRNPRISGSGSSSRLKRSSAGGRATSTTPPRPRSHAGPRDFQEIQRWNRTQIVEQTFVIPPSDLRLGDVGPLVDSYSDLVLRAGDLPGGRKAAVFVFEWPQPVSGDVVLSQAATSTIPEKVATGKLRGSRRWIYHERADALLPAYGVLWKLSASGQQWQFWIGG